jgi:hypothetical protein
MTPPSICFKKHLHAEPNLYEGKYKNPRFPSDTDSNRVDSIDIQFFLCYKSLNRGPGRKSEMHGKACMEAKEIVFFF